MDTFDRKYLYVFFALIYLGRQGVVYLSLLVLILGYIAQTRTLLLPGQILCLVEYADSLSTFS